MTKMLTNLVIATAIQGCSLDTKISATSSEAPDAIDSSIYETLTVGNLGFIKIGSDDVSFNNFLHVHQLYVVKYGHSTSENMVIIYQDTSGSDLKLEEVEVRKGGVTVTYNISSPQDKPYMDAAQEQFDSYLPKILQRKEELRLEALGKKEEIGREVFLE